MSPSFPCPSCGVLYPWRTEYVGKQTGCKKCGVVMTVPSSPPPARPPQQARPAAPPPAARPPSLFDELHTVAEAHRPAPEAYAPKPRVASGGTITMRGGSMASNAGLIRLEWGMFLKSFPFEPILIPLGCVAAAIAVCIYDANNGGKFPVPLVLGIGVLAGLVGVAFRLWQRKEQMWHGCICPAVVVSQQPYLVAVATDLTMGEGSFPAIKIVAQPLGRMTGGPPEVGTQLATVAIYRAGDQGHWADFEPIVINCVTTDTVAIRSALESIPPDEWAMLQHGLRQLKGTPRAGTLTMLR